MYIFYLPISFLPLQFCGCYGEGYNKESYQKVKSSSCIRDKNNDSPHLSASCLPASIFSTALPAAEARVARCSILKITQRSQFFFFTFQLYHFTVGTEWKERIGTLDWIVNSGHFCFVSDSPLPYFICVFNFYSLFADMMEEELRERTWCRTVGIWLICLEITLIGVSDAVNNTGPSSLLPSPVFSCLFFLCCLWFHWDLCFHVLPVICFLMFLLCFYFTLNEFHSCFVMGKCPIFWLFTRGVEDIDM